MSRTAVKCALVVLVFASFELGLAPRPAQIFAQYIPQVPQKESLEYGISLLGIPAGMATMEANPLILPDGVTAIHYHTTARSNDFISFFFPVRNVVDSTVDRQTRLPRRVFFQRREGSRHEDFDITFDHQSQRVTVLKDGKKSILPIPAFTHDLLSCVYYLRQIPALVPGNSEFLTIHHDKKNYEVEVKVEEIEPLIGPWGRVETIRLLAIMPFRGIFLNEGNIQFWLTHDRNRVPVKMKSRVIVGTVEAVLEKGPL